MSYRIGFHGCAHLGYSAQNIRRDKSTGWDLRAIDGHVALHQTYEQMLTADVRGVFNGGDVFHWSNPVPRDVAIAIALDDLRAATPTADDENRWARFNTGNHDVGGGSAVSAAAMMHRPTVDALAVFRGNDSELGPLPGVYEVHQPDPDVPVLLHIVSHDGLVPGQGVDPQPIGGYVNVLTAHGIFLGDERMRDMVEAHGEQRLIPRSWADRGWDAVILSDLHTMGPVPGYGERGRGQVWYTGSAVRRGFSDSEGTRGWLLLELADDGTVSITPQPIWQRPQLDLPVIDGSEMTGNEINDLVTERLSASSWWDDRAADLTGDGGYLLRQVIRNVPPVLRRTLNTYLARWDALAKNAGDGACWWEATIHTTATSPVTDAGTQRTLTQRIGDYSADLADRAAGNGKVAAVLAGISPKHRDHILHQSRQLVAAGADVDDNPGH